MGILSTNIAHRNCRAGRAISQAAMGHVSLDFNLPRKNVI